MFNRKVKNQLLSTLCGNLLAISYGGSCGWPSPSLPILQSDQSPLATGPVSIEEGSWMSSMLCIGGLFGTLFYGWVAGKYGRRLPILSLAIPQIISWIIIVFAPNPLFIYIGRFLGGFIGAGVFVLLPLFVTEISDDNVRGFLGSLLVFITNFGYVIVFTIGNFYNYKVYSMVMAIFPLIFMFLFLRFPETPIALLKKGDEQGAEKSLSFYRNILPNPTVEEICLLRSEIEKLKTGIHPPEKVKISTERLTIRDFNYPAARKALLISIVLMVLNQLNGSFAMLNYTVQIFAESGSTLSANVSTIIIGIIQLIASYLSTILIERAGRKPLMGISAAGIGTGVGALAIYTYLQSSGFNVESYRWVPIVSFSFSIFMSNFGVLNLPFLIVAELLPEKIRSFGTTLCLFVLWSLAFLMLKFFPIMSAAFGMHICFFAFSICSFVGSAFVFLVMPETKGKSFEEILELLGGK